MKEQMIRSSIIDGKIDAEIHADRIETAIEMFMEIADAICVQAERTKLMPSKEVCGTLLGYIVGQRYMTEEAVAIMEKTLKEIEGVSEWIN